jgi:hypothetical protein
MNQQQVDFTLFQKAIESLVLEGCAILQVILPDNSCAFFSVYEWTESFFNSAQSVDFNTVTGINITEFLNKQAMNYMNRSSFIAAYNKVIDDSPVVQCQFHKNAVWFKWQQMGDEKKRRL